MKSRLISKFFRYRPDFVSKSNALTSVPLVSITSIIKGMTMAIRKGYTEDRLRELREQAEVARLEKRDYFNVWTSGDTAQWANRDYSCIFTTPRPIDVLREEINKHLYAYHVLDAPTI